MKRAAALSLLLLPVACASDVERTPVQSRTVSAQRGPVEASAVLTPGAPVAGERMILTVRVEAAANVAVTTPLINIDDESTIGQFNVLEQTAQPDLPLPDGRRTWTQQLVLDTFATGDLHVPPLHVAFTDNRGTPPIEGFLTLPPIDITVASALLEGETQLRALRDNRPLPVAPMSAWWWLAVPAVLALAIAGVAWSRRGNAVALVPLTPAERARRALALLELDDDQESCFARVVDIVRRYLEEAFGLRAPRATTHEFLREAQHSNVLSQPHRATLHELLQVADLVKFARHMPGRNAGTQAMHTALHFVDDTSAVAHDIDADASMMETHTAAKSRTPA